MITQCAFGSMTVDGTTYSSDLIIYPDGRVADNWWRKSGHRFRKEDIEGLISSRPEILVAGIGVYGLVRITSDLKDALAAQGIELIAKRTKKAAEAFNRIKQESRKVAGCFHLTC